MKVSRSLLIWDCEGAPLEDLEFTVYWQSYTFSNRAISIPRLVEEKSKQFRAQYLALIYEFGESKISGKNIVEHLKISREFSYWWMTLLAEKCNYSKSPQIDNIIKILAFSYWLNENKYDKIKLVSANKNLAESLQQLSVQMGMDFIWKKVSSTKVTDSLIRRVYSNLPNVFKAVISLLHYLLDRWKLKGVGVEKWKNSNATTSFISYFFNLDSDASGDGKYRSGYWTDLPDVFLDNGVQTNWIHLYVVNNLLPTTSAAKDLMISLNNNYQNNQNHVFIDSFLSFNVVYKTFISWFKLLAQYGTVKQSIKEKSGYLWPLMRKDLKESLLGTIATQNLLFYYLFREGLTLLKKQKIGVYLQENQGWEYGCIAAWKHYKHESLIGMPHSTVRFWDLRYFFDPRTYQENNSCKIPLPNKVAVNGAVAKKNYIDGGYLIDNLVEVEALRYLQLEHSGEKKKISSIVYRANSVLILGDYLQSNTDLQMQLLQKASKQIGVQMKYIVKPHPACPILQEDYPELSMSITNRSTHELIEQCSIAYTSSVTSASVDAYCAGKPVISVLDPKSLNLSPLRGCSDISFVSTAEELAKLLNNIERIKVVDGQGEGYFYLDEKLPKWKKILINSKV